MLKRVFLVGALAAFAGVAACMPSNPQSTFGAAGPVANTQKDLFFFILLLAAIVFVIVESALIVSIILHRRKGNDEIPTQTHGNTRLEITWTLIPVLILAMVAVPTVRLVFAEHNGPISSLWPPLSSAKTTQPPLDITVIGHQWWWEVQYPGLDISTANEIEIPTGRPIKVKLESMDVIHSFWVPKLAGKTDMIPNHDNYLWMQASDTGVYNGQCAEYCGDDHSLMRFIVKAMKPADFQQWVDAQYRPDPTPAPGSAAAKGQTLFAQHCSTCHTTDSWKPSVARQQPQVEQSRQNAFLANPTDAGIISAPDLTHLAERMDLGAGLVPLTKANLEKWIHDPSSIKPDTRMQALAAVFKGGTAKLTTQQIDDIATYLMSLKPVPASSSTAPTPTPSSGGDPVAQGKQLYQSEGCAGCHSTDGSSGVGPSWKGLAGSQVTLSDGSTVTADDAYLKQSIVDPNAKIVKGFSSGVMPEDFGSKLSSQQIDDLIAYIKSLK